VNYRGSPKVAHPSPETAETRDRPGIRFTKATEDIIRSMIRRHLADANTEAFGLELAHETGYGAGTTYPVLRRLEKAGWLLSREENNDDIPRTTPRPPRVYYRINPDALGAMRQRLAEIDARRRSAGSPGRGISPAPVPAWGSDPE
jgi:DNA-binding PadR family transcriptional regulator